MAEADLDTLQAAVLSSRKYAQVAPDLVRSLGACELTKRRNMREAIKATKDRLHQIAGAYLERSPDYARWLGQLEQAQAEGPEALCAACRRIMAAHASARERLGILDRFYAETLRDLPPIRRVLDIACGLNPLATPWMPLAPGAEYYAYDIYRDLADFCRRWLALLGLAGGAEACDILANIPRQEADLALVLKALPCLEQIDKEAGRQLLERLRARYLLVSFPVRSLGGVSKGMPTTYEAHFQELVAGHPWRVQRFSFPSELAFLVDKRA